VKIVEDGEVAGALFLDTRCLAGLVLSALRQEPGSRNCTMDARLR
jgi:hypothetical protein